MTQEEREKKLKQTVRIELTVKEVKQIEHSLFGWADTLIDLYGLERKPKTAQKKKMQSAVDELRTLAVFFNKLYR